MLVWLPSIVATRTIQAVRLSSLYVGGHLVLVGCLVTDGAATGHVGGGRPHNLSVMSTAARPKGTFIGHDTVVLLLVCPEINGCDCCWV